MSNEYTKLLYEASIAYYNFQLTKHPQNEVHVETLMPINYCIYEDDG